MSSYRLSDCTEAESGLESRPSPTTSTRNGMQRIENSSTFVSLLPSWLPSNINQSRGIEVKTENLRCIPCRLTPNSVIDTKSFASILASTASEAKLGNQSVWLKIYFTQLFRHQFVNGLHHFNRPTRFASHLMGAATLLIQPLKPEL